MVTTYNALIAYAGAGGEETGGALVWRRGEDFAKGLWGAGAVFFGALEAGWRQEDACLAWVCCRCLISLVHRVYAIHLFVAVAA